MYACTYVSGPVKIVSTNYTPSYIIMNISSSKWNINILLTLKDSPLNSACVVENLCCYFKQIISYEKTDLKK